jgi:hypothetical protein
VRRSLLTMRERERELFDASSYHIFEGATEPNLSTSLPLASTLPRPLSPNKYL